MKFNSAKMRMLMARDQITSEQLANKMQVARQTIYFWRTDKSSPSDFRRTQMAKIFQVPESEFTIFEDNKKKAR